MSREILRKRFEWFNDGRWEELIREKAIADEASTAMLRRRRRRQPDESERRAARAHSMVQMGELSRGRAVLEAAELAPGTNETLEALRDPRCRPPRAREPIPIHLMDHVPDAPFALDEDTFAKNVRSARKGSSTRAIRNDRGAFAATSGQPQGFTHSETTTTTHNNTQQQHNNTQQHTTTHNNTQHRTTTATTTTTTIKTTTHKRLGTLSSKLQKKKNSSKNTFVQNHFIQNRRQFHPRHFHPKTGSSMTLSSKTHPKPFSSQTQNT